MAWSIIFDLQGLLLVDLAGKVTITSWQSILGMSTDDTCNDDTNSLAPGLIKLVIYVC